MIIHVTDPTSIKLNMLISNRVESNPMVIDFGSDFIALLSTVGLCDAALVGLLDGAAIAVMIGDILGGRDG